MRNNRGFTLTEILMVIVILGILSAIALPRFYPQKEKAYVAEALGILSAIRQGEEAYRLDSPSNTYLSADDGAQWLPLGIEDPDSANWTYKVEAGNGPAFTATATRSDDASDSFAGKTITLSEDGTYGGDHPFKP